ncbi:GM17882 [Drosophila sechellia]|uniref:GM17882 n=1 Tax=Drosophila sechellia TaxID=7238 RepID=B4IIL9_DROSE|nr:GM17882 [Drosophila sechellia]
MLSAQDAKRISRLVNDVQPPLHLESEEEMQDQEEKVLGNITRKERVSKISGRNISVKKLKAKKTIKAPLSQSKSKIDTRSKKSMLTKRKKEILKMYTPKKIESKKPTRISNRKSRIQDVLDCEKKMEEDSCPQENLNKETSSPENGEESSCIPKELNKSHSVLEELVTDNDPCAQEELNESYDSQDKLEEIDDPKGSAEEDNLESLDAITGCVLGLVEKEFERDPACSESSETLEGNAEVIVAMLNEEQDMMQKNRKRSSQCSSWENDEPPAKKRKC